MRSFATFAPTPEADNLPTRIGTSRKLTVPILQGVCKLVGGFTVFCERALPGERLRARVTSAKKSFATARKIEILRQHSNAVEAPCAHFHEGCGGCSMQNLAYASQLRVKEQQVCHCLDSCS